MNLPWFVPNWIGDAVMATPALRACGRTTAPRESLASMKPYVAGALEGGDWFDEVILPTTAPGREAFRLSPGQLRRRDVQQAVLFP